MLTESNSSLHKIKSKGNIQIKLYWGEELIQSKTLIRDGQYTVGENSNIGMSFPHSDVKLTILGGNVWLNNIRQYKPTFTIHQVVKGSVTIRCEIHVMPGANPIHLKAPLGFAVLFTACAFGLIWIEQIQRFVTKDALPIVATLKWSPIEIRSQSYIQLRSNVDFQDSILQIEQSGPFHQPDDSFSGYGYYQWYREQVKTSGLLPQALRQHQQDPYGPRAHWMLGLYAYAADDPELALWHFYQLDQVESKHRDTTNIYYWMMLSYRRLGRHQREFEIAKKLYGTEPGNIDYLSSYVNVLIRKRDLAEAEYLINSTELSMDHPVWWAIEARLLLAEGKPTQSLESLRRCFLNLSAFTPHQRTEFVRDIALDPSYALLRQDSELRNILIQVYGAQAPRKENHELKSL